MTTRGLVVALCLAGRFDESIEEADVMRRAWERLGRPVAGWMAPAVYLVALVYGLRSERDAFETWWEFAEKVCLSPGNTVRAFTLIRLALHEGRLDDAQAQVRHYEEVASTLGPDTAFSATANDYDGYLAAAIAEVGAAAHAPGIDARLADMQAAFAEHLWAGPTLLRAQWRSTGDLSRLHAAVEGFTAIGARFEEAATRSLLPGTDGENGREMLTALGCSFTSPL